MGNEMPIPCCSTDKQEAKLLEEALKKDARLNRDIQIAKQNKLVNGTSFKNLQSPSQEISFANCMNQNNFRPLNRSSKNKNQKRVIGSNKDQLRSILKPSRFSETPNPKAKSGGKQNLAEISMTQLSLKLQKLELEQPSTEKFKKPSPSSSKPDCSSGGVTQNSTPTTIEERNQLMDETLMRNECQMEDLFNSDEGDDADDKEADLDKSNFSQVSSLLKRGHHSRRDSNVSSKSDLIKSKQQRCRIMSIRKDVQQKFDAADLWARAHMRVHRRSNTEYEGLFNSLQHRTDGKLSQLLADDRNQEFDASLLSGNKAYKISEGLYEQKRSRRGANIPAVRIPAQMLNTIY